MVEFGVRLQTRNTLLEPSYSFDDMVALAAEAEALGFDSVWVGDSVIARPRLEPLTVLSHVAATTDAVDLGTACIVTPLRNPVQFAQAWITLDILAEGRTVMAPCIGTPSERNRKEYEVCGLDRRDAAVALEEGMEVVDALWREGSVTYSGDYYSFEDVSFDTGQEARPFAPVQDAPRMLFTSNPAHHGEDPVVDRAVRRIVDLGTGWLCCCRAQHADEYRQQWSAISSYARERGRDPDTLTAAYVIDTYLADTEAAARAVVQDTLSKYHPVLHSREKLEDQGPMGPPDVVIDWVETFASIACDVVILTFYGDRREQMRRFADEVLSSF